MIQAIILNVMYCTGKTPKQRKSKYITASLSNIPYDLTCAWFPADFAIGKSH